jgi:hypothetical protein
MDDGMRSAVPVALVAIFLLLAALHVFWALGGAWGARVAVPEVDGKAAFHPGRGATLAVASLLALAAAVIAVRSWVRGPATLGLLARTGTWTLCGVFALRAIGNLRTFGFFKTPRATAFARYDTLLFSPLCLAISLGCLFVAWSTPPE